MNESIDYKMHRIASNSVFIDDKFMGVFVVELYGNRVVNYYPLEKEVAFTEWVNESICLYHDLDNNLYIK